MKLRWLIVIIAIAVSIGVSWDVYRWRTFKEVTKSDVNYWKWKFVIDDNKTNRPKSR